MRRRLALAGLLVATPAAAHVTAVPHAEPGWTFAPELAIPLGLSAVLYALGARRLSRRAAGGRQTLRRRSVLFGAGWLCLAASVVSPLHQAGELSFTAHMIEHELLMLAAAPLLVLSRPLAPLLWSFPVAARRGLGRVGGWRPLRAGWRGVSGPVAATLIQAAALWLWHAPALFDRALASDGWHIAQHLTFLASALIFWSAMLQPRGREGVAAVCLFATSVVAGFLGALMAFSASPWYARYAALGLAPFGLTPAEDQQLAGLLMWIPGGLVHAAAALALVARALRPAGLPRAAGSATSAP